MELEMSAKPVRRRKFVVETGYTPPKADRESRSGEDYREKVKQRILLEKNKRTDVLQRAKRIGADGKSLRAGRGIDFSNLDQRGEPSISFDPHSPLREHTLKILNRKERDPERKKLMAKIGTEFGRIYTRYRRDAQRDIGHVGSYEMLDQERGYAAEAGMWCIVKAVTPRQLLEYWHTHIKTFAAKNMKVPPLSLLKSHGIVDQVSCAAFGGELVVKSPKDGKAREAEHKNSFSDPNQLDRRLRPGLERAGFGMGDYNDRFLVTIQNTAKAVARGRNPFVSAKVKPMVSWAAENLYAP